jgi:ATP-binding cassette subfamily F protein 1
MYEQKRREVNKAFEKYEKQLKAAKAKGQSNKQSQEKVGGAEVGCSWGERGVVGGRKRSGVGGGEGGGCRGRGGQDTLTTVLQSPKTAS